MRGHCLFLFLLLAAGVQSQTQLDHAVNFTVTDTEGQTHELFDYLDQDRYVLLDFFFTTCNPCIGSIPYLNQAYEKYGCNNGNVVFLSIDFNDTNDEVIAYKNTYGSLPPAASGLEGGGNPVIETYGISAFPTVILIAPDRKILNKDIYPVTFENLDFALAVTADLDPFPEGCMATGVHVLSNSGISTAGIIYGVSTVGADVSITLQAHHADCLVRLYDLSGHLLASQRLSGTAPLNQEQTLHLTLAAAPPAGFYVVELTAPHSRPAQKKVFTPGF